MTSINMTNAHQPTQTQPAPDAADPLRDVVDAVVDRVYSNTLQLWRLCDVSACRRRRSCIGETARCLDTCLPLIAPEVSESGWLIADAKCDGLTFDEAVARLGNEPFGTHLDWIACLERCNSAPVPRRRRRHTSPASPRSATAPSRCSPPPAAAAPRRRRSRS